MQSPDANKLIEKIKGILAKGFDTDKVVKHLKDLRPFALEEQDPLVTKVIRLSYEHIEAHEAFPFMAGFAVDDEGEEIPAEPGEDKDNLLYLLDLLLKSDNKYNREEIKEFRTQLKEY